MSDTQHPKPFILAGREKHSDDTIAVVRPSNGELVDVVCRAGADDVEAAIEAAVRAFETTRSLPSYLRARICRGVARRLERDKEHIARDLALEAGKPITLAQGEVGRAILTFNTAAEEATRVGGEILPYDYAPDAMGCVGITRRFPVGPVAAITPFNFPLNLVSHKLAPAIACGCPVVLKPASATPLSALNLASFILEEGWPNEALSVLPCKASDAAPLVEDERFKLITFTGSMDVGWGIKNRAGKKRVSLELGGNAAAVVHSDADLEYAAKRCAQGGFGYAGQSCISVQRIFVQSAMFDRFTKLLVEETKALVVSDELDPKAVVGPMITEQEAIRIEHWVAEAAAAGAKVLTGGKRKGAIYYPTVLTNVDDDMKVSCREVFGPVVVVSAYDTWDEALAKVNHSDYGLQAGIFTSNVHRILKAHAELEVGGLVAGDVPTYRVDPMPYGGAKDSGNSKEGPRFAIEEMTELKLLLIRSR